MIAVILCALPATIGSVQALGNGKYVVFTMDDGPVGQYNFAKPILDTYGYKASFMIVCNWVGGDTRMSWSQISDLASDGQDIESHTMTHPDLNHLSADQLQFELGGSKKCLQAHGFNPTVFAYPRNHGSENATVVNVVSQYYASAKTLYANGPEPLWFLACNGYKHPLNQTNCATYTPTGKLQFANRYGIRMNSIDNLEVGANFNDTTVYNEFVDWMNSQTKYNVNGTVAIPIVTLHEIVSPVTQSYWLHTNQVLFSKIIVYLHDNGFKVLTLRDLGYDNNTNTMFIKEFSLPANFTKIPVNASLLHITVNPNNNRIYVSNINNNQVSVFDGNNNTLLKIIPVGKMPKKIATSTKLNEVFVENTGDKTEAIINSTTNIVINTVSNGTFVDAPIDYRTHRQYIGTGNTVQVIDTTTSTIIKTIYGFTCANSLAVNPILNLVYVTGSDSCMSTTVKVINGTTNKVMQTKDLQSPTSDIAVNSKTGMIYTISLFEKTIYAIKADKHGLL